MRLHQMFAFPITSVFTCFIVERVQVSEFKGRSEQKRYLFKENFVLQSFYGKNPFPGTFFAGHQILR